MPGTNSDNLDIQNGDKGQITIFKMPQPGKRNYLILINKVRDICVEFQIDWLS